MTTRVAIDVRMHAHSGIGTYITNLVPLIVRARPEWEFCLLGPPLALSREPWASLPNAVVRPLTAPIYSVREQYHLFRAIPRNIELFWAPHYNIPLATHAALVVTIHDVLHLVTPAAASGLHRWAYARFMFGVAHRRAARLICVSEFTRREIERVLGARPSPPVVTHIGVDPSWGRVPDSGRPWPRPYIVSVGNVKPHKNLATLLQSFATLLDRIPHDLVIIGRKDGLITRDDGVLLAAEALGPRVHFTGPIEKGAVQKFVACADALVFPSLYEGFGLPPLEAMAAGCPVLASKQTSIPEVCGDAAYYFDPRSPSDLSRALLTVLADGTLSAELRRRGRVRAAAFTWDNCSEMTVKVLDEALDH